MTTSTMTGIEKAALVIMQMSQDRAAEVMRQFSETEAEELASEIIRLRKVEDGHADAAISEFHAKTRSGRADARGGKDAAALLLEASFGQERAASLLDRAASAAEGSFEFFDTVDPLHLSRALDGEQPETVALVLAHIHPDAASAVFGSYPLESRVDVAQALATLRPISPEIVQVVAETLKGRVRSATAPSESSDVKGGVMPLVGIIGRSDVSAEHELLEQLALRDPALAEEVRSKMLGFDDLVTLDDRDVQQVIRGIDPVALATALKDADAALIEKVRANMSERNRELVDDEIANLGKVRKAQIVEARALLVRAIRDLEASGSLTITGPEEEADDDVA